LPVFDEKEALTKWDEENPDIIIQDSTKDDIDNDWILAEEEIEAKIKAYWSPKE
jgi:PleD family two-component response regulator